jgi:hypothetical protein
MVEVTEARITQTDLISREAAIALLDAEKVNAAETDSATDEAYNLAISHCIEALTNMPSAEQPPKRDDWVMIP